MIKFKTRGFVSLVSTFSFLISLVSGIVLYFTPQGRIAHWVNWTFWGLDKETWGALHINSSLVFFIIILFHIYYNWKLMVSYIKQRARMAISLKLELALTVFLSIFMVAASIWGVQPFKQIIDWNESIKDSYAAKTDNEPPIPHAELMTVEEFCEKLDVPIERFENRMKNNNWEFEKMQTIEEIARHNEIAPAEIYKALQVNSSSGTGAGAGWGRMTLQQVCDENNVDVDQAIERLHEKGITADPSLGIRALSSQAGIRPYEAIEIILHKKIVN